jgi:hypothetical protein
MVRTVVVGMPLLLHTEGIAPQNMAFFGHQWFVIRPFFNVSSTRLCEEVY